MGFIVLVTIVVLWILIIEKIIKRKFKTPKRGWSWYKHDNKAFAILFSIIFIAFILFPFIFPDVDLFLIFPFVGMVLNLLFSFEKYIYKREEKLHIIYISDAILWFILGFNYFIFFS